MLAILGFKMADNFGNMPIVFVDLGNVCIDTKIMFLCHLEAEILNKVIWWSPISEKPISVKVGA